MRTLLLRVTSLLVGCSAALSAQATTLPLLQQLVPADLADADTLGAAVALGDTLALVGSPRGDDNGLDSGAAYLFDTATGVELAKLLPDDGAPGDLFGSSVAIDGTLAVVGSFADDFGTNSGAAYLFDTTTGAQLAKLLPDDLDPNDLFGYSVAISGTIVLVGAPWDDDLGVDAGAVYVFDATTGSQLAKLLSEDVSAGDFFGEALAIDGTIAVVGARLDDTNGTDAGAAYVFDLVGGTQLFELLALDGAPRDELGGSVAISGRTIVVGAARDDDAGPDTGSAYVFDAASGMQRQKLLADDGTFFDFFGVSVAVHGAVVLVGARGNHDNLYSSGAAYLFDAIAGEQTAKLVASDLTLSYEFGSAVALRGANLVVGAPTNLSGAAYVFRNAPAVGFRNAGANPASFTASPAWTGSQLRFAVDLTSTGHSQALVFGFDSPTEITLGRGQTLLCLDLQGGGGFDTGFLDGPLASIELQLPNAPSLSGLSLCTQALHAFGVTPFALSNAQDLVVGGCPCQEAWVRKLRAADPAAQDRLGAALALDGTFAVVGTRWSDASGQDSGAAYVFDVTTGAQLHELVASDGQPQDYLGTSVSLSGPLALVGARGTDDLGTDSGSAYVFDMATGAELHELHASDGTSYDSFGLSVAMVGSLAVVGAPGALSTSGAAYLFDARSGSELQRLLPSDGAQGDFFGQAVASDGSLVVVTAFRDDDVGSAYVFDASTGAELAKLTPSDGSPGDAFGFSVAIVGAFVVVGAPGHRFDGSLGGAVYLFDPITGTQLAKLVASDSAPNHSFGDSVAIEGTEVLVGAPQHGAAYRFDATTGLQTEMLHPACDAANAFGSALALDQGRLLVGAEEDNLGATGSGSVFVY